MRIYLWGTHSPLDGVTHWVQFNVTSHATPCILTYLSCLISTWLVHTALHLPTARRWFFLSCATCDLLLVVCPKFPIVASMRPLQGSWCSSSNLQTTECTDILEPLSGGFLLFFPQKLHLTVFPLPQIAKKFICVCFNIPGAL